MTKNLMVDKTSAKRDAADDAALARKYEEAFDAVIAKVRVGELATHLGEKIATVSNWRERGIPPKRCKAVESLTGIPVNVLRPDDWEHYWPPERKRASAAG